jgi:hypothetical protein
MPISAVIDNKILSMHGGLAYDLHNIEQIKSIARPTEVPDSGIYNILFINQVFYVIYYGVILRMTSLPTGDLMIEGSPLLFLVK